jgi:uncharacterized protein YndB with AHSA1/START domain
MLTVHASRTISAPAQDLWELISDPHHLPRWWPRVTRVENVEPDAFTEVLKTSSGKVVRADFRLLRVDERSLLLQWSQQVEGTPFARVLKSSETELSLYAGLPSDSSNVRQRTEVRIELRQSPRGFFPRFGTRIIRRAAVATLQEALEGLERIVG